MKVDEGMLLRNGVTGFFSQRETIPASKEKLIRSKVFQLVTYDKNLKIKNIDCAYPKNYMRVVLSFHDLILELYINLYYEYLYMDPTSKSNFYKTNIPIEIIESLFPCLSDSQVQEEIKYLNNKAKGLDLPHELNDTEIQQVLYFRPRKVFEILFNEWD